MPNVKIPKNVTVYVGRKRYKGEVPEEFAPEKKMIDRAIDRLRIHKANSVKAEEEAKKTKKLILDRRRKKQNELFALRNRDQSKTSVKKDVSGNKESTVIPGAAGNNPNLGGNNSK